MDVGNVDDDEGQRWALAKKKKTSPLASAVWICTTQRPPFQHNDRACRVGHVARSQQMSKRSAFVMFRLALAAFCRVVICRSVVARANTTNTAVCARLDAECEDFFVMCTREQLMVTEKLVREGRMWCACMKLCALKVRFIFATSREPCLRHKNVTIEDKKQPERDCWGEHHPCHRSNPSPGIG